MRVLFICKKRVNGYGVSLGLVNSANFVRNFLNYFGIASKVAMVHDANQVDKVVTEYAPTHIICEALWVTPNKFKELLSLKRHQNRIWINRLHSQIPFIANEGMAFEWIKELQAVKSLHSNFYISCNSMEFNNDINEIFNMNSIYLPNIYHPTEATDRIEHRPKPDGVIDVGCFGAIRPMKNHLMQAVAAIEFANRSGLHMHFHINAGRTEQHGDQALRNLRALFSATDHVLVEHDWMIHAEFIKVVRTMDVGMQVSFSETFNIVAADFVHNNIPLVGSHEIEWLSPLFKADPNSSQDIVRVLDRAFSSIMSHYLNRLGLWNHNRKAKSVWLTSL